jgi:branched-chain amino acid transport system permease protein
MTTSSASARVIRGTRASRAALWAGLALVAVGASMPFWAESSWMRDFVEIACYFIFAMMWNLLAGYGGMVSIGQQAFFGFGGYVMLMLGNFAGFNPFVAIPVAALAAALIALPVSWVAFRLQGGYFAIGTWVIAEVFRLSFANMSFVGGGSGTSLTALRGIPKATRESVTFWMALACVVASVALVYLFLRSKQGLALLAIRDNEVAAESQGIAVQKMKLAVYVVAAFGAGLAGALYFVGNLRISPDAAFSVNWTAFAIFMVVIGGIGRIEGPIVGALVFFALNKLFSDYGTWYLLGLGLLAIVVTIYFKQGLWGFAQQRWGWSLFPTRRHLAPSATDEGTSMLYAVWATDHEAALPDRKRVRDAHRARLRQPAPHAVTVLLAGPTLDEADEMNGTLLVVQAASVQAVQAFIDDDPYVLAGVHQHVEIRQWRCGLGPLVDSADPASAISPAPPSTRAAPT